MIRSLLHGATNGKESVQHDVLWRVLLHDVARTIITHHPARLFPTTCRALFLLFHLIASPTRYSSLDSQAVRLEIRSTKIRIGFFFRSNLK